MERERAPMSPEILMSMTRRQDRFVRKTLETAEAMAADTKSTARRAAQRCKSCFYDGPFLAGQAFTYRPCMCCGEVQTYSSTATDVLCMACAKAHELCKKCGEIGRAHV